MITEQQLNFHLVRQKDHILSLINAKCFTEAETCLMIVEALWRDCNYTYKFKELIERIQQEQGLEV